MTDRDRLAADLQDGLAEYNEVVPATDIRMARYLADRLIALGWRKVECWCPVESPEQPGGGVNPHCPQHGTLHDEGGLPALASPGGAAEMAEWMQEWQRLREAEMDRLVFVPPPHIDEERLARAVLRGFYIEWCQLPWDDVDDWKKNLDEAFEWYATANQIAAAIAKAYREDEP